MLPLSRTAFRPLTTHHVLRSPSLSLGRTRTALASTLTSAITADHAALKAAYTNILAHPTDIDVQTRYGNQFIWALARHSVAEELLVYPAMQKYLGEAGAAHADRDRAQHHEVKELLAEFQALTAESSTYVPKLKQLWSLLERHIEEEEQDHLPQLETALAESDRRGAQSEKLAKSFERTKMFVPTRSHPAAGEKPLFEGPMGLLTAPIDRIADVFRKFPDDDGASGSSNPLKK